MLFTSNTFADNSFFDQFLFSANGSCDDKSNLLFNSAGSADGALLGLDSKGRELYSTLHLQLFNSGEYYAVYRESAVTKRSGSETWYEDLYSEELQGNWQVVDSILYLDNFATGAETSMHRYKPAFSLTFSESLNDSRLLNVNMNINKMQTNVGPDGVSINEYCGVN